MPFDDFTNPFRDPASVPDEYRHHPSLQKLFRADGSYVRPAEDLVTLWAIDKLSIYKRRLPLLSPFIQDRIAQTVQNSYAEAKRLRTEAETIVTQVKARIERMILGQEKVS